MGLNEEQVERLTLAVLGLTAAVGQLEVAVLVLAKQPPPPSSKRRGGK